jgi:hypothetical protein
MCHTRNLCWLDNFSYNHKWIEQNDIIVILDTSEFSQSVKILSDTGPVYVSIDTKAWTKI